MKLTVIAALALAASMRASMPTPDEIASALTLARTVWHQDAEVAVRMEPMNPCPLVNSRDVPRIAEMQTLDRSATLITDDPDVAPVTTHTQSYVIRLNSNCDWDKLNLKNTVIHEYGHILIGGSWHSSNPASVMYYVVCGVQRITEEDRMLAERIVAK